MHDSVKTVLRILLCVALAGVLSAQRETPVQYRQRAAASYEKESLPKALAQVSQRAGLTSEEETLVASAFREHIGRFLHLQGEQSCFSRKDWQSLFDQFDESVEKTLPGSKAIAVQEWRRDPRPQGNALGFLFSSPWMRFKKLDEAVDLKASSEATDCGFFTINSACPVDQCVLDAVKQGKAFRAMYEDRGFDSQVGHAVIGLADRTGLVIRWDSMGARLTETPCRFHIERSIQGCEHVDCE